MVLFYGNLYVLISCGNERIFHRVTSYNMKSKGAFHSTKISGNSGPKLNGTVLTYRKFFGKEGPPFEVDRFFRLVRSDRKSLFHSKKFRFAVPLCRTFWKFLSETEWNGSVHPGWYNHPENFPIYCSICHVKFSKSQTGIFGRMESALKFSEKQEVFLRK